MNEQSRFLEEHNKKINALKSEYETLEKTFWVTTSFLLAVIAHLLYQDWYLSIGVLLGVFFLGWKFLAERPFTNNTHPKN